MTPLTLFGERAAPGNDHLAHQWRGTHLNRCFVETVVQPEIALGTSRCILRDRLQVRPAIFQPSECCARSKRLGTPASLRWVARVDFAEADGRAPPRTPLGTLQKSS